MRRISLILTVALLGLLVTAPAVQAAPSTAFTGEWIGQDPASPDGDGSTVHLYVYGGSRPQIVFIDEFGTICVNNGASTTVFASLLSGFVDGNTLYGRFNVAKCGSLTLRFLTGEIAWWELSDAGDSDPSNDTLWDGFVTWSRVP